MDPCWRRYPALSEQGATMAAEELNLLIGGEAGQGIQSISSIIAKTFVRHDFYVFINQDFASRIRGGHNFDQVRISNAPVRAIDDKVQILIALDKETTNRDIGCLADNGVLLFDGDEFDFTSDDSNHLSIPFTQIASKAGKSKIMANSVAIGAAIALTDFELQPVLDCMQEQFQSKGSETVEKNKKSRRRCPGNLFNSGRKRDRKRLNRQVYSCVEHSERCSFHSN